MRHPPSPTSTLDRAAYVPCLQSLNAVVSTVAAVAVCALLWRVHDPRPGALLTGQRGAGGDWAGGCQYGAQPYYFEDSGSAAFNDTPGEWRLRTFDSACEPRQLIEPLLNASRGGKLRAAPLVILIFGDSIDRIMLERFCKFAGTNLRVEPGPKPTQKRRYREITYCNSSSLVMIHSWTNGMMHQAAHEVMVPERSMAMAAGVLFNVTGRGSPDILLFGSNLWDLRGFMQQDEDLFPEKLRKALPPKPYLGVRVADAYIDNVRRFMGMLSEKFPDTRFSAVHTTSQYNPRTLLAYEAVNKGTKRGDSALELPEGHSRQIIMNNWVATLNSALRHVAQQDSIPLVDLEAIHLQLPAAHCYTHDGTHPHGEMLVAVCMNLLLNLYERDTRSDLLAAA